MDGNLFHILNLILNEVAIFIYFNPCTPPVETSESPYPVRQCFCALFGIGVNFVNSSLSFRRENASLSIYRWYTSLRPPEI